MEMIRKIGSKKKKKVVSKLKRLSSHERRSKIVSHAMETFAKKGFLATTSQDLAKSLGVSEALLFKHFATKDALVRAIEDEVKQIMDGIFNVILKLPTAPESLALAVAFNVFVLIDGHGVGSQKKTFDRLVVFSLLSDGRFFRRTSEENIAPYFRFLADCFARAKEGGEIVDECEDLPNALWFCHHLAGFLTLTDGSRAIQYSGSAMDRNLQAIAFSLRGIGFTPAAVKKYANGKWLAKAFGQLAVTSLHSSLSSRDGSEVRG